MSAPTVTRARVAEPAMERQSLADKKNMPVQFGSMNRGKTFTIATLGVTASVAAVAAVAAAVFSSYLVAAIAATALVTTILATISATRINLSAEDLKKHSELTTQVARLETRLQELNRLKANAEAEENQSIKEFDAELHTGEGEITSPLTQEKLEDAAKILGKHRSEIKDIKEKLVNLNKSLLNAESTKQRMKEDYETQIKAKEAKILELSKQLDKIQKQLEETQKNIPQQTVPTQGQVNSKEKIKVEAQEKEKVKLQAALEQLIQEKKHLEDSLKAKNADFDQLKNTHQKLLEQKGNEVFELQEKLKAVKKMLQSQQHSEEIAQKNAALDAQVEALRKQIQNQATNVETKEKQIVELQKNIQTFRKENEKLSHEFINLKELNATLVERIKEEKIRHPEDKSSSDKQVRFAHEKNSQPAAQTSPLHFTPQMEDDLKQYFRAKDMALTFSIEQQLHVLGVLKKEILALGSKVSNEARESAIEWIDINFNNLIFKKYEAFKTEIEDLREKLKQNNALVTNENELEELKKETQNLKNERLLYIKDKADLLEKFKAKLEENKKANKKIIPLVEHCLTSLNMKK
ncbi:hypothetical protein [Neochlamydia sp. S13]|uniref:hypothetical protein n=1 Tax=Neochlamydia sp. S13 TaxID=1353976 RepID=UPI0005AA2F0D|nr:hypothetical protein [Neochlamydia sp. S13]BBI17361.1 hypothetical protein NCS13_1_1166 [Neochlamydia sp. S13]